MHALFILLFIGSFVYSFIQSFELTDNFIDQLADGPTKLTIPLGRARKDQDASSACGPQPLVGWLSRLKILIASGNLKIGLHSFMDVEAKACSRALKFRLGHITSFIWMCAGITGKHLNHFGTGFFGSGWACEGSNTFFLNFRLDPHW